MLQGGGSLEGPSVSQAQGTCSSCLAHQVHSGKVVWRDPALLGDGSSWEKEAEDLARGQVAKLEQGWLESALCLALRRASGRALGCSLCAVFLH